MKVDAFMQNIAFYQNPQTHFLLLKIPRKEERLFLWAKKNDSNIVCRMLGFIDLKFNKFKATNLVFLVKTHQTWQIVYRKLMLANLDREKTKLQRNWNKKAEKIILKVSLNFIKTLFPCWCCCTSFLVPKFCYHWQMFLESILSKVAFFDFMFMFKWQKCAHHRWYCMTLITLNKIDTKRTSESRFNVKLSVITT